MKWIEVQIETTTELEEMVVNFMYDVGVKGLAIEDPNDILAFQQSEEDWDFIDPCLINQDYEGIIIKGYFPEDDNIMDKIELIRDGIERNPYPGIGKVLGKVTTTEVHERDWAESWKKYYKPSKIGNNIVIKPTWEEYQGGDGDIVIELDPGMAFGTGTHETTIMCIEALESYVNPGQLVYDIGCGSGILSIVAAKLGAKKVVGVDLDNTCIRVSRENISLNGVENLVDVKKGNLLDVLDGEADIIVSNIIDGVIVGMVEDGTVKKSLVSDGVFIASGIVNDKVAWVEEKLKENGFKILEAKKIKDWACIVSRME
ncbi:MAG TPA: 50S ribosomal protein L11 methyltransferase [Tepidimicrobium sp.]|nr:50S ribosomal protein L11 methyltransferase [Tepidimicrobium sp.]